MRWQALFADLEAQAAALATVERAARIDDLTRAEHAGIALVDRLRAATGQRVRLECVGGVRVTGVLTGVGPDWLLVDEDAGREALVLLGALATVTGLGRRADVTPELARLGVRSLLRRFARDRLPLRLTLVDGQELDGTIDRVGADHVEIARLPVGETDRLAGIRRGELVAIAPIAVVRRRV